MPATQGRHIFAHAVAHHIVRPHTPHDRQHFRRQAHSSAKERPAALWAVWSSPSPPSYRSLPDGTAEIRLEHCVARIEGLAEQRDLPAYSPLAHGPHIAKPCPVKRNATLSAALAAARPRPIARPLASPFSRSSAARFLAPSPPAMRENAKRPVVGRCSRTASTGVDGVGDDGLVAPLPNSRQCGGRSSPRGTARFASAANVERRLGGRFRQKSHARWVPLKPKELTAGSAPMPLRATGPTANCRRWE